MAETHSRAKSGMGGGGKSKGKGKGRIHTTHIKHFKSGGHLVTHDREPSGDDTPEPDEALMGDKNALMQHLQDTVPDNGSAQMSPPAASQAALPPDNAASAAASQGM